MKDVTLEVLKDIRAELGSVRKELREELGSVRKELREELGSVREELAGFRRDVDERFELVGRRQTAAEVRLATEIVAVVGAIHELRDVLVADRAVREQVSDHEVRLQRLEGRT